MEKLILKRFAYTPMGTFGSIELRDGTTIYTVEDAWRENAQNVSCIPLGTYQCSPRFYNRGGYPAIHIENVPGRSHILIHRGNTELDVQGCVVTGMQLGFIKSRWAVADSRGAFQLISDQYGDKHFELEIVKFDPAEDSYLGARANSATFSQFLQHQGVVVDNKSVVNFIDVSDIKPSLLSNAEDSVERNSYEPFSKAVFEKFGVTWLGDIGVQKSDENYYRFVPTKIDSQRGNNGEPLCSLMPMGEKGFLNMAAVLSPSAEELEAIRKKLEAENDKDVSLSELALTVCKAALVLQDRSGEVNELSAVEPAKNAPHTAVFVTQLSTQDMPLVNAAFAGEANLLKVYYDVDFAFPVSVTAQLSASASELKQAFQNDDLWSLEASSGSQAQLVEDLIDSEIISLVISDSPTIEHLAELRQELVAQLVQFARSTIKGEIETDKEAQYDFNDIELERKIEVVERLSLRLTSDVADWQVGNVLFE